MGAKLNATGAFEIRLAFQRGDSIRDIAARFNVSEATVWNVVNYETWQRVGPLRAPDWLPGEAGRAKRTSPQD